MNPTNLRRFVLVALTLCLLGCFAACRSGKTGVPNSAQRAPIEKPWTKEGIEAHEYLWIETSTGKRGLMTGPVFASDEVGEYLSTKTDPTVHLPLAEIVVLDAVDLAAAAPDQPVAQNVAVSVLALWGAVLLFLPTILLIIILF
ncbi:MAG: hypothetical protein JNL28_06770 [Planctomycetes bacterium]|nr:hypothetical protein [Planctomycetota bacterium]